jgi:hypothetical protein
MKPSNLQNIYPWNSVYQKSEDENNMQFILSIIAKNGDEWGITFEQYKEWKPDTKFTEEEFLRFSKYLKSEHTIRLFSKNYNI